MYLMFSLLLLLLFIIPAAAEGAFHVRDDRPFCAIGVVSYFVFGAVIAPNIQAVTRQFGSVKGIPSGQAPKMVMICNKRGRLKC